MDLRRRSMTGILVYAIMLPVVFWPFDFHTKEPYFTYAFALSMFIISLLRIAQWYATERIYQYSATLWRASFALLSLAHACVLSFFLFCRFMMKDLALFYTSLC